MSKELATVSISINSPSKRLPLSHSGDFFPNEWEDNFFFAESPDFSSVLCSASDALHSSHPESMPTKDDFTTSFFNSLLVLEEKEQRRSLNHIAKLLKESLHKSDSDTLICTHLPTIVRLATEIPFQIIRSFFLDFLNEIRPELERRKIAIPEPIRSPSKFFTAESVLPIDTVGNRIKSDKKTQLKDEPRGARAITNHPQDNEEAIQIFQEAYLQMGRVNHLVRILAWHPIYYHKHSATYNFIMCSPINPLTRPYCHYLAIMAAASMKCSYLVQDQSAQFLSNKGPEKWLEGFSFLPTKLKNLAEVNAILAHQPWRLKSEHIERLLKGQEAWSLPELVHAFVVLASYRALAAFVWGMGINCEIDFKYKDTVTSPSSTMGTEIPPSPSPSQLSSSIEEVIHQVDTNTAMLINKLCQISGEMLYFEEEALEKKVELFAAAGKCNTMGGRPVDDVSTNNSLERNGWTEELSNQFSDPYNTTMNYVDFDVKSTEYNIFHVQDFSWGTHCFSLVKRYYSSAANLIDDCFKCIRNLTYQSFHDQEAVDTGPFRMAIWYYVHRIFGIFHDDFDYAQVNLLVPLSIISYINHMASVPWRLTASHLSNFSIHLKPEEKAHIALLVMEARKQSELIYALHAINKFLGI